MNDNDELIKKANLQEIVDKGEKIYEQIKSQYEPQHNGKFLAIECKTSSGRLTPAQTEFLKAKLKLNN